MQTDRQMVKLPQQEMDGRQRSGAEAERMQQRQRGFVTVPTTTAAAAAKHLASAIPGTSGGHRCRAKTDRRTDGQTRPGKPTRRNRVRKFADHEPVQYISPLSLPAASSSFLPSARCLRCLSLGTEAAVIQTRQQLHATDCLEVWRSTIESLRCSDAGRLIAVSRRSPLAVWSVAVS